MRTGTILLGASDLRDDLPGFGRLKRSGSALPQSGRTGTPNRHGQKTAMYGGLLHKKREGGKARAEGRAPSHISTAT